MRVKLVPLVLSTVLLAAALGHADVIDRVLAVVAGTVITQSDVDAAISFQLVPPHAQGADPLRSALDQLIRRELVLAEVNRYAPIEANQADVAKKMNEIKAAFASPAAYESALGRTAMNETRLRDMVEANVRIEEYLRQRFGVAEPTEDETVEYYVAHRPEFKSGGVQLSYDKAKSLARQRFMEDKRAALIEQWVARLRRRAEVTDLYFADSGK